MIWSRFIRSICPVSYTHLQAALFETLQRRGTSYDKDSFKRIVALAGDEDMKKRWKFFLKTIKDDMLEFFVVIAEIQTFLEPVFEAIVNLSLIHIFYAFEAGLHVNVRIFRSKISSFLI